jgi:RimJ/RimL family protein N-acetyltransferase
MAPRIDPIRLKVGQRAPGWRLILMPWAANSRGTKQASTENVHDPPSLAVEATRKMENAAMATLRIAQARAEIGSFFAAMRSGYRVGVDTDQSRMDGMTDATSPTLTERLTLARPSEHDLPELHELHADPAVWTHLPSARHTSLAETRELIDRYQTGWEANGLDVWVARDTTTGSLVGIGGPSLRGGLAWNLYYRLAPAAWGRGYAQELISAARAAASASAPDLPVVAFLLEHNEGSRRAAERAGLEVVWRGPDAGNPDPDAVRLVFADHPLTDEALRVFLN